MINNMLNPSGQYSNYDLILQDVNDLNELLKTPDWYGAKKIGITFNYSSYRIPINSGGALVFPAQVELFEAIAPARFTFYLSGYMIGALSPDVPFFSGILGHGKVVVKNIAFYIPGGFSAFSGMNLFNSIQFADCFFDLGINDFKDFIICKNCKILSANGPLNTISITTNGVSTSYSQFMINCRYSSNQGQRYKNYLSSCFHTNKGDLKINLISNYDLPEAVDLNAFKQYNALGSVTLFVDCDFSQLTTDMPLTIRYYQF